MPTAGVPRFDGPLRLEREAELGPLRLHFQDWPGGLGPLVCLPGQTAGGRSFDGLAAALAPEWRVIALDPRGRGRSAKPRHGYGYHVQVADTMALLDQFGFERVVLVGHSSGATIGLLIAAWYPERVEGLVLIDGGTATSAAVQRDVARLVRQLDMTHPTLEAYLGRLRRAPWFQPWTPELEAFFVASVEVAPGGGVTALAARWAAEQELRAYRDGPPDYASIQAAVRCPTLVVRAGRGLFGRDDGVLSPEAYRAMLARLPQASGVEIDGANHYTVLLGRPEGTIRALRAFLDGLPTGGRGEVDGADLDRT